MQLHDFLIYDRIYIQCHDNPDADAIGSAFGLYSYFKAQGKDVRIIYSGRNRIQKSNLVLMVEKLSIPMEYFDTEKDEIPADALLITTDCQYGAGNVKHIDAGHVAIIDHHQVEIDNVPESLIRPGLGSCSTIVWELLKEENFDFEANENVGTALYYGLYSDTNQLSEIRNPLDMDMRDEIRHNESLIFLFRNSNLSLQELEVAGVAMINYRYDEDHHFGVVQTEPCDPNILGLISDFLLQVDVVQTCLVYNENPDGYKISVRSCVREVNAGELAGFLTEGIGSGGGHFEKAGGFVSKSLFEKKMEAAGEDLDIDAFFHGRMKEYFESFELVYADRYEADLSTFDLYSKNNIPVGFVKTAEILPVGTQITVRTMEGDMDLTVEEDLYIIIGVKGEVYPNRREKFEQNYEVLEGDYDYETSVLSPDYVPTLKNREDGSSVPITEYAKRCIPTGTVYIYAKELERGAKVFTAWDTGRYMLGKPGDYLVVRREDLRDIYIAERDVFKRTYTKMSEE